jgi:hypothetical protein
MRIGTLLVWLIGGLLFGRLAFAEGENVALAEALFRQGKELAANGRYAEACPKLADSHRLDPGGGAILALAHCYEGEGKLASAWAAFAEAVAFAERDLRTDRRDEAKARIVALEPRLFWLIVSVDDPVENERVLDNGRELPRSVWSSRFPLDPGSHELVASAPGHVSWKRTLHVGKDGGTETVTIPPLAAEVSAAPPTKVASPRAKARSKLPKNEASLAPIGWSMLAGGAAAMAVGSYFGLHAIGEAREADDRCPEQECSNRAAVDGSKSARRSALVSTVAFSIGALGVGAGLYLVVTAPVSPSRDSAQLNVRGVF